MGIKIIINENDIIYIIMINYDIIYEIVFNNYFSQIIFLYYFICNNNLIINLLFINIY